MSVTQYSPSHDSCFRLQSHRSQLALTQTDLKRETMGSGASTPNSSQEGPKRTVLISRSSQEAELRKRTSSSAFASRNCSCSGGVESILVITEGFPKDMQARAELLVQAQVAVLAIDCEFQKSAPFIETMSFLKDNRKEVVAGPLTFHLRPSGAIGAICFAFGTWDSKLFDVSSSSSPDPQPEWSIAGTRLAFMSTSEAQTVLANAISEPEMDKLIAEESEILDSELQKARSEPQNSGEQGSSNSTDSRLLLYVFAGADGECVAAKFASLDISKDGASIQLCSQELTSDLVTLAKARVAAFVITDACMGGRHVPRLFEAATRWKKPILPINAAKARLCGWLAMAMVGKLWYQVNLNDLEQIHTKYAEIPSCPCKVDDLCLASDFLMCLSGLLSSPQRTLEGAQNQDREATILQLCQEKVQVMSGLNVNQIQNLCAKVQDLVANYHEASGIGRDCLEALGVAMGLQALETQHLLESADCSYTPHELLPEEPKDGLKLSTIHYQVTRLGFVKLPSVLGERGVPLSGLQLDAMFSYQWGGGGQATVLVMHHQDQMHNLRAWFDVFGHMQGNANLAMATAVENVACIVVFLTRDYVKSINCRLEFQYAAKCTKSMVFVFLEDPKLLAPELATWITDAVGVTEFNVHPSLIRESHENSTCRALALDFTCGEQHGGPMINALFSAIRQLAAVCNRGPPRIAYGGNLLLYATTSALRRSVVSGSDIPIANSSGSSSHLQNPEEAKKEPAAPITARFNYSRCGVAFRLEVASSLDGCRKHGAYYMGGSILAGRWVCCEEQCKDGSGCQVAQHIVEPRKWTVDPSCGTHTWQPE